MTKIVFFLHTLFFSSILVGQNVMISDLNSPNEISIMQNPTNPAIMVAGANLNNVYYSSDTGKTWNGNILTSSYGVWGDPVIQVDTSGNFYFFHLSNTPGGNWIDRIVCQKSSDNGSTWSDGTFFGLDGNKDQDKEWCAIDKDNNNLYVTWTQFDLYGSTNPNDSSTILFTKSTDGGNTWSTAKRINNIAGDCIDEDNTVEGAVPAIGPSGEIYVSWAGPEGLTFDRSIDEGETWLENDIFIDSMPTGWDYSIPGLDRCNGLPITTCDRSGGEFNGTIYVNWSDQRDGEDDTNIWLSKSVDGGNTWSAATKVNDDSTNRHQFMTWMDIDQTNGNLFFIFYDRRAYTDNQTDVYMAISTDGGETFVNRKISETPFTPNTGIFFGDYNNITAHNNIIRPAWTRMDGGNLSVWTDVTPLILPVDTTPIDTVVIDTTIIDTTIIDTVIIDTTVIDTAIIDSTIIDSTVIDSTTNLRNVEKNSIHAVEYYPNPVTNLFYVSFKLHEKSEVSVEIFTQEGKNVHTVLPETFKDYGKHIIAVDIESLNLPPSIYLCKVTINGRVETTQIIKIE